MQLKFKRKTHERMVRVIFKEIISEKRHDWGKTLNHRIKIEMNFKIR